MDTFLFVYSVSSVVYLELLVYLIIRNRKNNTGRIYIAVCLVSFLISSLEIMYKYSSTPDEADLIKKLVMICWCIYPCIITGFYGSVTSLPRSRKMRYSVTGATLITGLVLCGCILSGRDFFSVPVLTGYGWRSCGITGSVWLRVYLILNNAVYIYCTAVSIAWLEVNTGRQRRIQAIYLCAASLISIVIGEIHVQHAYFFPFLNGLHPYSDFAEAPGVAMIISSFVVWNIIVKHGFMPSSLFVRANDVIDNFGMNVVFTDNALNIIRANRGAEGIFSIGPLEGKNIYELFERPENVNPEARKQMNTDEPAGFLSASPAGRPAEKLDIMLFSVRDRFTDPVGIIWLITPASSLKRLAERYDLSGRELEVLMLLIKGFSNAEIAETLDIKPGTVKLYVHGIYRKTGIKNRIELSQILK